MTTAKLQRQVFRTQSDKISITCIRRQRADFEYIKDLRKGIQLLLKFLRHRSIRLHHIRHEVLLLNGVIQIKNPPAHDIEHRVREVTIVEYAICGELEAIRCRDQFY